MAYHNMVTHLDHHTEHQLFSGHTEDFIKKFLLAPMGVLAPRSAHTRPSAWPPIDTSEKNSAHMSGGGKIV